MKDAGKYYQILIVRAGLSEMFDKEAERLVNVHYFENHDPLLNEYLDSLLARYCVAEKGMLSGKTMHPELKSTQTLIRDLKEMKEAVAQWQP